MSAINLLEPQDWGFPTPICYGPGRLAEIASLCKEAGMQNLLIVTDSGSKTLPYMTELTAYLNKGGIQSGLYADISPNPRDDEIAAGKRQYHGGNHDGIIAIGGGSGMDGGKAIALCVNNDIDLWQFDTNKDAPDMAGYHAFPPLITIPTTAGTGAETECTAMVTDTARMVKLCIWHPTYRPNFALLDPEITVGLPANLTAWTGIDAMIHAIEGYCVPTFHPLCDGAALEGLRLIHQWLPEATNDPTNLEARGAMLVGSCLAGVSFLKGLGLVHAISHMVGAKYNTHHGLTNAIVMPTILRYNAEAIAPKIKPMADAMGLADTTFDSFYKAVCVRLDELNIPRTLQDIGVPQDCAQAIAQKALEDGAFYTNPESATVEQTEQLVQEALDFGR